MALSATAIMNRNVVTATPDMLALRLAELLVENGTGMLPVCAEDGSFLGVIDEEHLLRPLGAVSALHLVWWVNKICKDFNPKYECIQHICLDHADGWDLMSRHVATAPETVTLTEILKLWAVQGARPLPILREGKFVGLVGVNEVVSALARLSDGSEGANRRGDGAEIRSRDAAAA